MVRHGVLGDRDIRSADDHGNVFGFATTRRQLQLELRLRWNSRAEPDLSTGYSAGVFRHFVCHVSTMPAPDQRGAQPSARRRGARAARVEGRSQPNCRGAPAPVVAEGG